MKVLQRQQETIGGSYRANFTLFTLKFSGSLKERHWDGSLISVSFHIFDLSLDSSVILGFTSPKFRASPFWKDQLSLSKIYDKKVHMVLAESALDYAHSLYSTSHE